MKMKTKRKALLLSLCAVLLVVASVMGTMAYLTSTDTVTNTFSVGSIHLTLDEAPVDGTGKATTGARVKANSYNLLPGQEYDKDPTVHVTANSEDSWIFVKVENGISALEDTSASNKIAFQITRKNGWTQLKDAAGNDVAGVYYKEYTKSATVTDLVVFKTFKVAENANTSDAWTNGGTITVKAYAIQKAGFNTAADAWEEAKKLG